MIELSTITTLCLACILYLLGKAIANRVNFLKRIYILAPVIGGLIFAILAAALDSFGMVKIKLDASFIQDFFMLAFFTTIGLGVSLKLFKLGGKVLLLYFIFCTITSVVQNIVDVSLAEVLNIKPLLGLTAGSMSMEGGHGNAAAYGKTTQDPGIGSALTAALAAATLGLVLGRLIGGPVVRLLTKHYNLKPQHSDDTFKDYSQVAYSEHLHSKFDATEVFFIQFTIVVFCMVVGGYFSHSFAAQTGINVPIYVGSLFVAVIVRNTSESFNLNIVDLKITNQIGDVALGIFLFLALMSIQLIEIYKLAIPLIITVLVRAVVMILLVVLILFRGLGKDYDAAVMVGGFIGHGLGATPNAMASLDVTTKKYGSSPKAYLVVPIVGVFLIDLVDVIAIMGLIQWFS